MTDRSRFIIVSFCIAGTVWLASPATAQFNQYQPNFNNINQQQNSGFSLNPNQNMGNYNQQPNQSNSRSRSSRNRSSVSSPTDGQSFQSDANRSSRSNRTRNASGALPTLPGGQDRHALTPPAAMVGGAEGVQIQGVNPQGAARSSSSNSVGIRRSIADPSLQKNAILYLESSNTIGIIDRPMTVEIVLSNKKKEEYDRLAFAIQYDPKDLLLASEKGADGTWVKASVITLPIASSPIVSAATGIAGKNASDEKMLATDTSLFKITQNMVDSTNGLVFFEMKASEKPVTAEGTIVRLTFVPLREAETHVSFLFVNPIKRELEKEPLTCLMLADEDRLGTSFSKADGVVNLDLQLFKNQDDAERQLLITKVGENSQEPDEEKGAPLSLSLVTQNSDVNVGDTVELDITLSNPDRRSFDSINLLIAYNPRVLEPVDGDKKAPGINLHDANYAEKFAMDFSIVNSIDKEKGIVDYRKKATRKPCRAQGVLATIQFRALRPTTKTTFRVFMSETRQEPTTGISFRYQDRLGESSDPFDGVTTCSVGVRPTTAFLDELKK